MIPKVIHYCWFGKGEKPKLAKKCIESWAKYLPDYSIKEWNEDNFDLNLYSYAKEAYEQRRYAFVTDIVRLYALFYEGGIYMDTDVEVIQNLDSLLEYSAVSGFETETSIPTGLIASEPGHPMIKEFLDEYDGLHFNDLTTNVTRITNTCLKYGLRQNNSQQTINGFTLLPKDVLCPKSYVTGKIETTERSLTIHHFAGSWYTPAEKRKQAIAKLLGPRISRFIVDIKAHLVK